MRVLPNDTVSRGLAFRDSDYQTPNLLRWGTGKYLVENTPLTFWESQFWNDFQMAMGHEVEKLLRLTQIYPEEQVLQVLTPNGTPTELEGILAKWFPQTVSGNSLVFWESLLGIPSDLAQTDDVRRIVIQNRIHNRGQSPTVQYMLNIVLKYVDNAVIIDQNAVGVHDNSFLVRIISPVGVPLTDSLLRSDLDTFKPATLAYTIQYSETDFVALAERDFVTLGETDFSNLSY